MSPAVPKPKKRKPKIRTPLKRSGRPKAKRRTASEFARVYGSRARVAWVKRQPCAACVAIHRALALAYVEEKDRCHNAHTENGGMGRKADYTTIAPLCPSHHRLYDAHAYPFDTERNRNVIRRAADMTEARWQAHCGQTLTGE